MPSNLGSVATGASSGGTSVSATHVLAAGNNRIIIAWGSSEISTNTTHSSCYYDTAGDNVAMTKITGASGAADNGPECRGTMWYLLEADIPTSTGSKNVTLTAADSTGGIGLTVWAIKGAKQAAPEDSDVTTNTSATSLSGTVDTTTGAYLVCGSVHAVRISGTTPDSPQIELSDFDDGGGARNSTSYEEASPGGSQSLGHTSAGSADLMVVGVASFLHLELGVGVAMTPVLMI